MIDLVKSISVGGIIEGCKTMFVTLFNLWVSSPMLIYDFWVYLYRSMISVITYHIFTVPAKPLHNEIVLILGCDTVLGRAFATQVVKLSGTAICVDKKKAGTAEFVERLNGEPGSDPKAHFFEYDFEDLKTLKTVLQKVEEIGDITVVVNCSPLEILKVTYYNIFHMVFPVMKGNYKGRLVFIRTFDADTRCSVLTLYNSITNELNEYKAEKIKEDVKNKVKVEQLSTTIAHVYKKIDEDGERNFFGRVKPDDLAKVILESVSKGRDEVFVPNSLVYVAFWLKFMPTIVVHLVENLLFGNHKSVKTQ